MFAVRLKHCAVYIIEIKAKEEEEEEKTKRFKIVLIQQKSYLFCAANLAFKLSGMGAGGGRGKLNTTLTVS